MMQIVDQVTPKFATVIAFLDGDVYDPANDTFLEPAKVPPIGTGLHEQLLATSLSYLESARSALQWISDLNKMIRKNQWKNLRLRIK